MLMFLWKPLLRFRAKKVTFESAGYELSDDIIKSYNEIKYLYKVLIKEFTNIKKSKESPPQILKMFLSFYLQIETLLLSLINEMFKKSFLETIEKRKPIFDMLNKILKIMIHFDSIRTRFPDAFCNYSLFKLNNPEEFNNFYTEVEDQKFSIISMISLPMGRLMLSLFNSDKFELFYPSLLSKRSRVFLDDERKKILYMYCRISERYNYKYILLYFATVYRRFYGKYAFTFDNEFNSMYLEYMEMLHEHE